MNTIDIIIISIQYLNIRDILNLSLINKQFYNELRLNCSNIHIKEWWKSILIPIMRSFNKDTNDLSKYSYMLYKEYFHKAVKLEIGSTISVNETWKLILANIVREFNTVYSENLINSSIHTAVFSSKDALIQLYGNHTQDGSNIVSNISVCLYCIDMIKNELWHFVLSLKERHFAGLLADVSTWDSYKILLNFPHLKNLVYRHNIYWYDKK